MKLVTVCPKRPKLAERLITNRDIGDFKGTGELKGS